MLLEEDLIEVFKDEERYLNNDYGHNYGYSNILQKVYHKSLYTLDLLENTLVKKDIQKELLKECKEIMNRVAPEKNPTYRLFQEVTECYFRPYKPYLGDYDFNGELNKVCISNVSDLVQHTCSPFIKSSRRKRFEGGIFLEELDVDDITPGQTAKYIDRVEEQVRIYLSKSNVNTTVNVQLKELFNKYKEDKSDENAESLLFLVDATVKEYLGANAIKQYKAVVREMYPHISEETAKVFSGIGQSMKIHLQEKAKTRMFTLVSNLYSCRSQSDMEKGIRSLKGMKNPFDYLFDIIVQIRKDVRAITNDYGPDAIQKWIAYVAILHLNSAISMLGIDAEVMNHDEMFRKYHNIGWEDFVSATSSLSLVEVLEDIEAIIPRWWGIQQIMYKLDQFKHDENIVYEGGLIGGSLPRNKINLETEVTDDDKLRSPEKRDNITSVEQNRDEKFVSRLCKGVEDGKFKKLGLVDKLWVQYKEEKFSAGLMARLKTLADNDKLYIKRQKAH